ncbi:hypothetical protein GCM10009114_19850 [Aliiglaciecola litoralis]|uniref:Uncharacterized protein n=2 Tax=Aliiglaciecola litoralis TaxID=582857 RepID=A0ABP3WUH1_9ALTE
MLQGCSTIEQPTAQRPLVEHEYVDPAEQVESPLASALTDVPAGATRVVGGKQIQFGRTFFAASGLLCRNLVDHSNQERIYCKRSQSNWFAVNNVIAQYSESQELEAK